MYSEDPLAKNTYENPNAVVPTINQVTTMENGVLTAKLQPLSWNVFRMVKA